MMVFQRLLWFAAQLLTATVHAEPIAPQDIYVIDGDTTAVHGKTIRLVGFDAPELGGHAHCGIERCWQRGPPRGYARSSALVTRSARIRSDRYGVCEGLLGDKQLGVGAVDVQSPNVETGEQVVERIKVHRWLAPEQTVITSSCGLNHLPRHIALGKLRAMTEAKEILLAIAKKSACA